MWESFLEMAMEYLRRQQERAKMEFQIGSWIAKRTPARPHSAEPLDAKDTS